MPHNHEKGCLAVDELDELCCIHLDKEELDKSDRWVVETTEGAVNVFTYSAEDAIELVRADGKVPTGKTPVLDPQEWP